MNCEICNGNGWFKQANYQLEIMEWVQCYDCLAQEKYLEELTEKAAKLINRSSAEKLSLLLAKYCVTKMDKERLETMLTDKNFVGIMSFLEVNIGSE
jgi:hypothetical protein|tara:strand:- start:601 stop:891 length:291 start_codon:yes stop_codon:yes gene_type:complete